MDKNVVNRILLMYPKFENFISAGTVTQKAARMILGIDRNEMQDIFLQLLEHGAIYSAGGSAWRAKPELVQYLEERRVIRENSML